LYQYNIWYVSHWPSSMQVGKFLPDLRTRRSPTHSDTHKLLYSYNWFSWWWARGCSKHVENWNKHIEKELCVKMVIYKNYTEMHGQQNVTLKTVGKVIWSPQRWFSTVCITTNFWMVESGCQTLSHRMVTSTSNMCGFRKSVNTMRM
jgi:hypothetical protein